jgi:HD-like signal output (HDOD) protein
MSPWLIGIIAAVVLLVSMLFLLRRNRAPGSGSAPSNAQLATAAKEAYAESDAEGAADTDANAAAASAAAALESPAVLTVRSETIRSMREIAFGTSLPPVAFQIQPGDEFAASVAATLINIVDKPNYAPRRPMQLPKLLQAINDETASRGALSQIIAGDPALAGNLLRLANSPFYRHSPEPIESLDRAVAMLGIEGLRSMIAAALMQPVFRISGGGFAQFGDVTWEHSLFAANAAETHASMVDSADPFAAQLLALIQGLATIVVFSVARDAFLARQRKPDAAYISALIDAHAISVARQVAASWELSERIDTALAEQVVPQATPQATPQAAPRSPLGRALQFGTFIGALAVLRGRGAINDEIALEVLKSAGPATSAAERVWNRLGFMPD